MKQQVSPAVFVSIIVVILLVCGVFAWRTWVAPSTSAAPAGTGKSAIPPMGAGPDAEALRKRDEYNRAHPDAAGSR